MEEGRISEVTGLMKELQDVIGSGICESLNDWNELATHILKRIHALEQANREAVECLLEVRNAAAALCRLIVDNAPEIMKELPHQYNGFGKRADELLARLSEKKP